MTESKVNITVGIDVSKNKLDIWLHPLDTHIVINNNLQAIGQHLYKILKKHNVLKVGLEATGGYEKLLVRKLVTKGINTFFIHPNLLKDFQKSKGIKAKTDKSAAYWISQYLFQSDINLKPVTLNYVEDTALHELSMRLKQLKDMFFAENNRLEKTLFEKKVKSSCKKHLKYLKQEIEAVEKEIDERIENSESLKEKAAIIKSFKGAGQVTVRSLIVDMPELGYLTKTQAASLLGVAPINRDSGKKSGYRYIHGGRGHVRRVIYMTALVAIRFNSAMKVVYERLRAKGKAAKVALVAVMRRIIVILNAMLRENKTWLGEELITKKA